MVEDPGCKLKGIKIKAKLRGQTVHTVKGNAVDKQTKKKQSEGVSTFHQLIGRELDDVQTLGKELFMYFGDICLRVHFLMSGQSFINSQKVDNDLGGKAETASLELQMSRDLLTFRNSAVDIRPTDICKQKFDDLNNLDICSPIFNFKRAVALVIEQQGRQICDVLLDQMILPGVGNIIKNEALFDSGIRPNSKVEELKEEHVTHLIKMTRDFTNIFYMCRRDGKPLYPYYKIYSKRKCKQCEGKVTITRLGDDSERVTYYCEICQTNDLKKSKRTLPTKNSLLGWVTTTADEQVQGEAEWSCAACTLLNPSYQLSCRVCQTRKETVTQTASSDADFVICLDETPSCPNKTALKSVGDERPSSGQGKGVKRSAEDIKSQPCKKAIRAADPIYPKSSPVHNRALKQSSEINTHRSTGAQVRRGSSSIMQSHSVEKQGSSTQFKSNPSMNGQKGNAQSDSESNKIPPCPTHKRRCNMKEVHKKGDNYGRWFFSCSVRSCNFFEWADTRFPLCPDHGKPCTIRTVLKVGPNNGKKFFSCKMPKNKQCKFFEWAYGYDY